MVSEGRMDPSGSVMQGGRYSVRKAYLPELSTGRRKMQLVSWKHPSRPRVGIWQGCDHQGPSGTHRIHEPGEKCPSWKAVQRPSSPTASHTDGVTEAQEGNRLTQGEPRPIQDEEQVSGLCRKRTGTILSVLQKRRLRPRRRRQFSEKVSRRVCDRSQSVSGSKASAQLPGLNGFWLAE